MRRARVTHLAAAATLALSVAACVGLDPEVGTLFCPETDPCPQWAAPDASVGAGGSSPSPNEATSSSSATASSSSGLKDAGPLDGDSGDSGVAGAPCGPCHSLITEDISEQDACPSSLALWHAYVSCACDFGHPCYAACAAGMPDGYCASHRWQDAGSACSTCQVGPCGSKFWACNDDK